MWPLLAMMLIGLGCKEPLDLDATLFHCDENNPCAQSAGYECQYPVLDNGEKAEKGECRKGPSSTDSTGSDTGTDVATDTGSDTGSDVVTDTGSDTGGTSCNDNDDCQDGVACTYDKCDEGTCNFLAVNDQKFTDYDCCGITDTQEECGQHLDEQASGTLNVENPYTCGSSPENRFTCIPNCKATYVDVDGNFANGCEERILRVDQEEGLFWDTSQEPQGTQPDGSEEKPFKSLSIALWYVRGERGEHQSESRFTVQLEGDYQIGKDAYWDFSGSSSTPGTGSHELTLSNITLQGKSKDVVLSKNPILGVVSFRHSCVLQIGKPGPGQTQNVTIRNLTIDAERTSRCGIHFHDVEGIDDENFKAQDLVIRNAKGELGESGYGILIGDGGSVAIDGVNVAIDGVEIHHIYGGDNIDSSNPPSYGASFGIWASNPNGGQAAVTIRNSLIHDIMGYGFHPDESVDAPDDRGSVGIYVENIPDITIEHCSIHSIYSTVSTPPNIDTEIYPVAAIYLRDSATSGNYLTLAHLSIWNVGLMTRDYAGTSRAYGIAVDNEDDDSASLVVKNSIISRIGGRYGGSCGLCVADLHLDADTPTPTVPDNVGGMDYLERCGCSINYNQDGCVVGDDPNNSPPLFDLGALDACIGASVEDLRTQLKNCSLSEPAHETCPADNSFVECSCGQFPQLRLAVNSPAIDAGDPKSSGVCIEPEPNGCVVNLGHYGGTSEAQVAKDGTHLIGPDGWICENHSFNPGGKGGMYCPSAPEPDE